MSSYRRFEESKPLPSPLRIALVAAFASVATLLARLAMGPPLF